ncbi:MAG: glycine cleavage system aminomethyltransferase GcvT [Gemmatimonadetes bacterium]|nr:glycine cleavage system aminomethyltransferase GcvT [Gemmatimonadota bacterium]
MAQEALRQESAPRAPRRTPLYDVHKALGAKIIPFAGFEMPVHYPSGIVSEHRAVRERAGLFDISHMGELEVRGSGALDLVQFVTTNDASRLEVGQAHYSVICQEDGGALDDCLVYRFPDHWMLVVNASNQVRDREWVAKYGRRFGAQVIDRSADTALLALQGPKAPQVLSRLTRTDLTGIPYYHFAQGEVGGCRAVLSRTGYTGEDGFELYVASEDAHSLWSRLLEVGAQEELIPIGLGARDSLRLEMGYILYGNDLDENHTPLEAGLGWVVKLDKGDFLGHDALARQKEEGVRERLVGFTLKERGFPRHGYEVRYDGEPAGEVTSGILSPTLDHGIGMAYVPIEAANPGTPLEVIIRNRLVQAEVVRPPFYREGSLRR